LKSRGLLCDPVLSPLEFLFVGAGMFSDIGVGRWSKPFPTKFHNGDSKYKLVYEGIVIRDS
jgi:hypothetical protein